MEAFLPQRIPDIFSFTVIRKYSHSIHIKLSLTADKQDCKQKQRVNYFKSGLLSVFLSLHCYAVEPHF